MIFWLYFLQLKLFASSKNNPKIDDSYEAKAFNQNTLDRDNDPTYNKAEPLVLLYVFQIIFPIPTVTIILWYATMVAVYISQ